jgi:S1-C subfamily serine protease/predicted TPR repeat methyltransferase
MNFSRAIIPSCVVASVTLLASFSVSRAAELSIQTIVKRTLPSVVSLTIRDASKTPIATGSGFVVGRNMIATNLHVVTDAGSVTANFQDGRSEVAPGLIVGDTDSDLAILFVDTKDLPMLPLADTSLAQIGDSVIALGSPIGLKGTASTGIISAFRTYGGLKAIQTTAPISHGSSGGPLLDRNGRVLGITSYIMQDGENLNFAVSSFYLKPLIPAKVAEYWTWAEMRKYMTDQEKKTAKATGAEKPALPAKDLPGDTETAGGESPAKDAPAESEEITAARKEVRLHPKSAEARVSLGMLLGDSDREAANTEYRKAIELDPAASDPHFLLASAYYDADKYEDAIKEAREAVRLAPADPYSHNILGISLDGAQKYDEEIKELRTAVRLKADYAVAHCNLGVVLMKKNSTDEALFELREAARFAPDNETLVYELATNLSAAGKNDEAVAAYRKLIAVSPDNAGTHNRLGVCLYGQGKLDEAITEYKAAIRLDPKVSVFHENLGLAYSDQGDYDKAIPTLQKAISFEDADTDAFLFLGTALVKTGKTEEGRAQWKKVLTMTDPDAKKKAQDLLDAHPE